MGFPLWLQQYSFIFVVKLRLPYRARSGYSLQSPSRCCCWSRFCRPFPVFAGTHCS